MPYTIKSPKMWCCQQSHPIEIILYKNMLQVCQNIKNQNVEKKLKIVWKIKMDKLATIHHPEINQKTIFTMWCNFLFPIFFCLMLLPSVWVYLLIMMSVWHNWMRRPMKWTRLGSYYFLFSMAWLRLKGFGFFMHCTGNVRP